jgi:hypothetical protein
LASVSAGLHDSTTNCCSSARRTISRHSAVFPIPASPSSTSTVKRCRAESRSGSASESSCSRPTTPTTSRLLSITGRK